MKNKAMNNASRYLSRPATEIRTPLQRLKNHKVMTKVVSDFADGHVSADVGNLGLERIIALDDDAEQRGVEDPFAL